MSENFNIQGYTCQNAEIYQTLQSANVSSETLKALDSNSDNKISEDELVEFTLEEDDEAINGAEYKDDPTVENLRNQYKRELKKVYDYQHKLLQLRNAKSEAKGNLAMASKDSEARGEIESRMDEIQSKIDSLSTAANQSLMNMATINAKILERQDVLDTQGEKAITNAFNSEYQTSSNGVTSTSGTNGVTNVSSASLNVQSGSGTSLTNVTGDLSICLDRVAASLNTSRENAADYITTLCNTIGKGYFDPKIILSQIFSESSGNQSCSTTSTSKYVGLGQMSEVAVKEINKQFGTNYTFNDMNDASKNLQAMVYLMTYQYERYGQNLGAALTAYNVGHYSGTVNNYAQRIMSRA